MSYKTVYKPWGKEVWLELNDKYCYKRIYINAGTKKNERFRSDENVEKAYLEQKNFQFLYSSGDEYFFMDQKNYEQKYKYHMRTF